VRHFFSVDVEEHFHAHVFERVVPGHAWDAQPSRVEPATNLLLELLGRHGVQGTFFVLGWVAKRTPGLVRRIADAGHEIGSHSWSHPRISRLTPDQFRQELRTSRAILEDQSGQRVLGFRAPSFSIRPGMEWAFDVLLEEGFVYDSSIFPIRRPDYGWPGAPVQPYAIQRQAGTLVELPMTTMSVLGARLPASGGGYLRHFPSRIIHQAFEEMAADGAPGMLYVHPWEVDPDQPRIPVSAITRLRHYGGIERTLPRLDRMLQDFQFGSVRDWLAAR
jgi:polysaccharide deacetylase family protein (PEP-CTERM system associated)